MCVAALEETSTKSNEQNVQPTESSPASNDRTGPPIVVYQFILFLSFYKLTVII